MTIMWTGFPAAVAAVSADVVVGLAGGTANARFTAASWLFTANNLSDVANKITSFDNLSPLTTAGDLLIFSSGHNVRLAIGSTGQIATVVAGLPAWVTNPGLLIANNLSDVNNKTTSFNNISPLTTNGDLIYYNGTNNVRLAIGSTDQIFMVSGGIGAWLANPGLLITNNLSDVANKTTSFDNVSPLTTTGDLIYYNGTHNVRLGIGSAGQIFSVSGGIGAWVANPGLLIANNLSDLNNAATARGNLGTAFAKGAGASSAINGTGSTAAGTFSFAFGNTAIATNNGSVVWGDSNASPNVDSAANQFNLTFASGYRLFGGSVNVNTAGKGLAVAEGSNAKQGVVTLSSGIGVVANNSVTANSRIHYAGQDTNVTGFLNITARSTGSGFTITSSVLSDSGVVAYEIFEPAA